MTPPTHPSVHYIHPPLAAAEPQPLAWWQTPFTTLPTEIIKQIMYWVAVDDVVDFFPAERLHGPKHSTLPVMLTNKHFHRDLSELIHEKQEVINIVMDGSKRDQQRPKMFRNFASSGKRVSATPWHVFKKVRFHLQSGLASALTERGLVVVVFWARGLRAFA